MDASATVENNLRDSVLLVVRGGGSTVGVRESERDGISTAADQENGLIKTAVLGRSPQGEADAVRVCHTLIQKMNQLSEVKWNQPVKWEEQDSDIDCSATNADNGNEALYLQVVRPMDKEWWRQLSDSKMNSASHTLDEWAGIIRDAVMKKADRIPPNQRPQLVLAVDANRLPGLVFESTVEQIRDRHAARFVSMGFRAVWLVGPSASLTHRLDSKSDVG